MSDVTKMEYPNFIKTYMIAKVKDGNEMLGKVRINPISICSYYEVFGGDDNKKRTLIYVGSQNYVLDMTIEEVDEMMENIDRGLSIKE